MKARAITGLMLILLATLPLAACVPLPQPATPAAAVEQLAPAAAGMANPASQNCIKQGGRLEIEALGDGAVTDGAVTDGAVTDGQFGVCYFEDNRQCEEWALMRGECPVGGVKVTGYTTPAARYCAITGGTYAVTGKNGQDDEQGTCTLKNGGQCDVWDFYIGKCAAGAGPSAAATAASPAAAVRIPLKDALGTLEPRAVWQNFYDLTQIPRPSHHEEKVRDFLVQFGQRLGLATIVDDAGNVLIRKPAAKGMENRGGVILQAHLDMVVQKTPESTHDPLIDPIEAYVDGEWVVAEGTTLGADDGSGIAIAMAVLQTQTPLGPIEALFTVNEEDGNDGALGLQSGVLQGSVVINLDSETEGEFTIGSAGGAYANIETTYAESAVPADVAMFTVTVGGLKGGHSGMDINRGRGHAIKLLVRLLKKAAGEYGVRVAQIASGTAANAIPRDASALVVVPAAQAEAFVESVQEFEGIVKSELAATEPGLSVRAAPSGDSVPDKLMDDDAQRRLIDALYGTPQGVLRMSDVVPGLVETSTNMGIVNVGEGQVAVTCFLRSSVDSALDDLGQMIASVWDLAGVDVVIPVAYSAWSPDPNSPILLLMQDVYQEMYGERPKVAALHVGLECATIVAKYPGMDAISIGPTLRDVHTPSERMEIASVKKLYDFLLETLKRVG